MRQKLKYLICAMLTVVALRMELQPVTEELMKEWDFHLMPVMLGYTGYDLFSALQVAFFCLFYRYTFPCYYRQKQSLGKELSCFLPALFFGLCMVLGASYEKTNSWGLLIGCDNPVTLFRSLFAWCGYTLVFFHGICFLYDWLDTRRAKAAATEQTAEVDNSVGTVQEQMAEDKVQAAAATEQIAEADAKASDADYPPEAASSEKEKGGRSRIQREIDVMRPFRAVGRWYLRQFDAHPFVTTFVTLFLCFLPGLILFYPGLITPDTEDEICQVFGVKYFTANYLQLVDESVVWTNHHPVLYTLYLKLGLMLGHGLFGSYRLGLCFCTVGQVLFFLSVVSWGMCLLRRLGVSRTARLLLLLYFVISPRIVHLQLVLTKDSIYASCMLGFVLCTVQLLYRKTTKLTYPALLAFALVASLLRRESIFVVAVSLVVLLFTNRTLRFRLSGVLAAVLAVFVLWNQVLLPAFHVTPGSLREALSIPFQQTARYVFYYEEEVTEKERAAIDAVLDFEAMTVEYYPLISDYVKETYHEEADEEDLWTYFQTWWRMFWKHPGVYVEATINNIFHYFYPTTSQQEPSYVSSSKWYFELNATLSENRIKVEIMPPQMMKELAISYVQWMEQASYLPGTELLQSSALYLWLFLLVVVDVLRTKHWRLLEMLVPIGMILLVCLASPVDGFYFRYVYSAAICLPMLLPLLFGNNKDWSIYTNIN